MYPPPAVVPTVIPKDDQLPQLAIVVKSVRSRQSSSEVPSSISPSTPDPSAPSAKTKSADALGRRRGPVGDDAVGWTASESVAVMGKNGTPHAGSTRSRRKRRRVVEPDREISEIRVNSLLTGKTGTAREGRNEDIPYQHEFKPADETNYVDLSIAGLDTDIDELLSQVRPDAHATRDDPDVTSIPALEHIVARQRALLSRRLLVTRRRRELEIERVRRETTAERENIWVKFLSKRVDLRADMISEVGERIEFIAKGVECAEVPDDWSTDDYESGLEHEPVNIGEQCRQVVRIDWRDGPVAKGLSTDEISDDVALIRSIQNREDDGSKDPDFILINDEDRILGDLVTALVDIYPSGRLPHASTNSAMESLYNASILLEHSEEVDAKSVSPTESQSPGKPAKIQTLLDLCQPQANQHESPAAEMYHPPPSVVPSPPQTHIAPSFQQQQQQQQEAQEAQYGQHYAHAGYSQPSPNTPHYPIAPPPPYNYGYSQPYIQPAPPSYPPVPSQQHSYPPEFVHRQDPRPEPKYIPMHQEPYGHAHQQHAQHQDYYRPPSPQQAQYGPYSHPPQGHSTDQVYYPPPPQHRQQYPPLPPPPPLPQPSQQQLAWHQQPPPPAPQYQSQYPAQQQPPPQPPPPPPHQSYLPQHQQYSQHVYPYSQQPPYDSARAPPTYQHRAGQYQRQNQHYAYPPRQTYGSPQNRQYYEHHYESDHSRPASSPYNGQSSVYQYNTQDQAQYSYHPPPPPPPPPPQGHGVHGEQYNYSQPQPYHQQYPHSSAPPAGNPQASYQPVHTSVR